MPDVLLPVPVYEQSRDGACLPACVRMVLAFWGDERSEAALAGELGTKAYGTPLFNARRLESDNYSVVVDALTGEELEQYLRQGQPVIARVWTAMLDYWKVASSHVVVVVGFDETHVFLNDPAFPANTRQVHRDAFLAAWAEYDETAIVISPRGSD